MGRPRRFGGYPPCHRLGLTEQDAAAYVGASPKEFELLVAAGEMPQPKILGDHERWSRIDLEDAFSVLPDHPVERASKKPGAVAFPASNILALERNTDAALKKIGLHKDGSPEWRAAGEHWQEQVRREIAAKLPHYEDEADARERIGLSRKEFGQLIRKTVGYDRITVDFRHFVPKMCVDEVERRLSPRPLPS